MEMQLQSENINELAKALSGAQKEIKKAEKDAANPFFNSRYSTLGSVVDACRDALVKNELSVSQTTTFAANETVLVTTLMHKSGQWIRGLYPIKTTKQDPQAYGSALSYARRYTLAAIVGVASEDDDGNAASEPTQQRTTTPAEKPINAAVNIGVSAEEYTITFGKKYKGKKLKEIDPLELQSYAEWIRHQPDFGKYRNSVEAVEMIDQYTADIPKPPTLDTNDEVPF